MSEQVAKHLSPAERRSVLEAFQRSLRRESHVLADAPELLWQQVANRLQFEDAPLDELVDAEAERRRRAGAAPWLRLRTPLPESSALVRTLADDLYGIAACAFSPDGALLACAGRDWTLTLWDVRRGQLYASVAGHNRGAHGAVEPSEALLISCLRGDTLTQWKLVSSRERAIHRDFRGHFGPHLPQPTIMSGARAVSPDGELLAIATHNFDRPNIDNLTLYEMGSERVRATLHSNIGNLRACAFSPDGAALILESDSHILTIWDVASMRLRTTLRHRTNLTQAFAFSPDGELLASGSADGTLTIWEVGSGSKRTAFSANSKGILACAFSPDRKLVASAYFDNTIAVREISSGRELAIFRGDHTRSISCCAFSPDGRLLASSCFDNSLTVLDITSGQERATLVGHSKFASALVFSPDSKLLATASGDETLKLWDVASRNESTTPIRHTDSPATWSSCAFSPEGSLLAFASNKSVELQDVASGQVRATLDHSSEVYSCGFSPNGEVLVSGSGDGTLTFWEVANGLKRATLKAHEDAIYGCAFSPDGTLVASCSVDKAFKLWEMPSGRRHAIQTSTLQVHTCDFSPDGKLAAFGGYNNTPHLLDLATNEDRYLSGDPYANRGTNSSYSDVRACAFSPDGTLLASCAYNGWLTVWDMVSKGERLTIVGHSRLTGCAFSPDGTMLAASGQDRTLKLWDMANSQVCATIVLPGGLTSLAMHPYKPILAVGDDARNVYLVEVVGHTGGNVIVTAVDRGSGPMVHCPVCARDISLESRHLGHNIACPQPGCAGRMRVNPFVIKMAQYPEMTSHKQPARRGWWPFGRRG